MMGSQRPFSIYRIEEALYEIHRRLENITIEHLSYEDCVSRYDAADTLFYLDPPYFNHETDYGKNIFSREDFQKLADILRRICGSFLLSINDTPETRLIFAGHNFLEVTTTYQAGTRHGHGKKAQELLIANYDLQQLFKEAS